MNTRAMQIHFTRLIGATTLSLLLTACGGGGTGVDGTQSPSATDQSSLQASPATVDASAPAMVEASTAGMSDRSAYRMLMQASFGANSASIQELQELGRGPWITTQFALPWTPLASRVEDEYVARLKHDPAAQPDRRDLVNAFWREAITSEAQLRWRVTYALSQIFVVSLDGRGSSSDALGYADYYDTLARHAFGNYRQLLQAIATHPAMGRYLSHMGNMPADDATGRVPDENFAREIMQLFSIGLYRLNQDGSVKLDVDGHPIPTYTGDDIAGMAQVFTGWGWDCSEGQTNKCFATKIPLDLKAGMRPMVGYSRFHSTGEKRFLGAVVPAQSTGRPAASLKVALDTLANHPNVGPFIGRQLIQRLVTSNPSPAYVAAAAAAFADNGNGVRGDLRAVVRAILTHAEAREPGHGDGKVREPVLRLTALARAFPAHSVSGEFRFPYNEVVDKALGQTPLRASSVFNFYRPGYTSPGGETAASGLVAPELQISDETTVATYVRFMRALIDSSGFGSRDAGQPDIQLDFTALEPLAGQAGDLVAEIHKRLLGDANYPALRDETISVLESIAVPVLNSKGSNQGAIDKALRNRQRTALLLTVASPEFIVQH